MRRDQGGYTLVELVVVGAIFAVVLALTSITFNRIVSSSSHLVKQTETQIEGMIGLELLRVDLENAGIGLATSFQTPGWVGYDEAEPESTAGKFNDAKTAAPRAVVAAPGFGLNDSDYLVLKGTAMGMNRTARRWSYLTYSSATQAKMKAATSEGELVPGAKERVIVLKERVRDGLVSRELVMAGSLFSFVLENTLPSAYVPKGREDRYVVYGLAPEEKDEEEDEGADEEEDVELQRPFNRADYYIANTSGVPPYCAPNTGRLYKSVMYQGAKGSYPYPLLDCVADMRVLVYLDSDYDGRADVWVDDLRPYSAEEVREQVKEVRVFILAHEGKLDRAFRYPVDDPQRAIVVGEGGLGRVWREQDLVGRIGENWRNYRWRIYTVVVQPKNL